ncbi:MAG: hypothetical protein COX43_03880 [Parcubacteria group bacterium CG23_combo_of_CG06-09_8_20_14_all_35_9]|nr:MAG: hypothetical protein COX43_03880 [Parcubacteria group bacterium CG23_combo_of_CG06-09_8_20_14_all_35_9]
MDISKIFLEPGENYHEKKILLHVCCGVCGIYTSEILKGLFKEVVLYFYNPNIHPREEYNRRLEATRKVAQIHNLKLIEGKYDPKVWFKLVTGLEEEPEGDKRCLICYEMRLKNTFKLALDKKFDYFATSLTVSPLKNFKIINEIGRKISQKENSVKFLEANFKKDDGFKKSIILSNKHQLYRQNYCGCVFSNPLL